MCTTSFVIDSRQFSTHFTHQTICIRKNRTGPAAKVVGGHSAEQQIASVVHARPTRTAVYRLVKCATPASRSCVLHLCGAVAWRDAHTAGHTRKCAPVRRMARCAMSPLKMCLHRAITLDNCVYAKRGI